jgi:hypothetical protein
MKLEQKEKKQLRNGTCLALQSCPACFNQHASEETKIRWLK